MPHWLIVPSITFTQPIPTTMGLDGTPLSMDPTQYMAPMDLYDSIWGGKWSAHHDRAARADVLESPDPWSAGVDSMSFDFSAQPPPGQPQQQFYF